MEVKINRDDLNIPKKYDGNTVGRPPALDVEDIEQIIEDLLNLATQKMAAERAGVSEKTFYNYLDRGRRVLEAREEDPDAQISPWDDLYVALLQAVQAAENEVKLRHLENIENHSDDKWQASAWILERKFPNEFSLRHTVEHTGSGGGPVKFTLSLGDKPDHIQEQEEPDSIEEADYELVED